MESQLNKIITDLKESFNGQPWYGDSVMKKLNTIAWQNVNTKKYGEKSIAVLVQHIINWRIFVLKKLQGDMNYDIIMDSDSDWSETHIENEKEWNELKEDLSKTQIDLIGFLDNATEELLSKKVPGKDYDFGPILTSISQHDIYHLGQIAMLNAMEKN
ncbi:putative damage-inducible protein DinB [Saonia flava]|uniref:Putative damage-inducible protein DinB n=1 Tax=Saonia flava TaxID=523696 RepID=A0A846QSC5_9FLAO|nr:DinB family protein [Saonia flava]NJB71051.1 putative damage-inducible protein DinB [Saonia flava]